MKQQTIFNTEEEVITTVKRKGRKGRKSIKELFRSKAGYFKEHRCKTCDNLLRCCHNDKIYYKCEVMGLSHGEATDIRLKDYACKYYKEKKHE